ncbi:MAG: 1,4-dihydroxy-6-naphthoate synthase [Saprospiraceae bacterium]|nr:1,4-dihydroxy-6-naphthoate synthase [Saprospiraceae bacterium]MDW8483212.1 1,4-dihydroxy-6-naphthoate synthase [Saprospiraceae bacterium]
MCSSITLGYSPCPNDTFIFYALVHGKIDTEGLHFEPILEDVEALNRRAFAGELQVTKLSFHAFAHLTHQYCLLDAGSALGFGCGPLLVAKKPLSEADLNIGPVAIPGRFTTANFLFTLAYPRAQAKVEMRFSDIEEAVLRGEVVAGLIIHENRFTYAQKGLTCLVDLGAWWEQQTHLPIPLGGIVVRRDLPADVQQRLNQALRRSVEYAFEHPDEPMPYVRRYAQSLNDSVMRAHIDLYVNEFSRDLGNIGRQAVLHMFRLAHQSGYLSQYREDIFIN